MAKHKKTRKQKILADLRRKPVVVNPTMPIAKPQIDVQTEAKYSLDKTTFSSSFSSQRSAPGAAGSSKIATSEYKYLSADLRKTIFLTGFVVIVELVIKFVAKI